MIIYNTKIEKYYPPNISIPYYVKREDLCCALPGPPSAKMRGLNLFLEKKKKEGVKEVGYMDTAISMAGWGISYFAQKLNMKAVLYYPEYKDGYRHNQKEYIGKWNEFMAEVIPLQKPGQLSINRNRAKNDFLKKYEHGIWLPKGLELIETIHAVSAEMRKTLEQIRPKTIVISVGSGAMLAGILQGLFECNYKIDQIIGCLVTKGVNIENKRKKIFDLCGFENSTHRQPPLFYSKPCINDVTSDFQIIPTLYEYHEKPQIEIPFPCNEYYDAKAYEWMIKNIDTLSQPILFWNIGA